MLSLWACTDDPSLTPAEIKIGKWGGNQFEMNVSDTYISFTWGCAVGQIEKALRQLDNGSTQLTGKYKFIGGVQPIDPDLAPKEIQVTYKIKIEVDTAIVEVYKKDSQEKIGAFMATFGKDANIAFCA